MSEYVLSTNLYTYAQVGEGFFGWPLGFGEADVIRQLNPGDVIIPKFAASPTWGGQGEDVSQQSYWEAIGVDYEGAKAAYAGEIASGAGGPLPQPRHRR